jgi:hypothetical protein
MPPESCSGSFAARADLRLAEAARLAQRQRDVVEHVHPVEQRRVLEQIAHVAPQLAQIRAPQRLHLAAEHLDLAAVGPQQSDHVLEDHALAGAGGAHQHQRAAFLDAEREPLQHLLGAEALVHVAELDRGHHSV